MSRWVRVVATALLVSGAVAGVLGGLSRLRIDTTAASFLSSSDPTQKATIAVARAFGGDPIVVLLETGKSAQLLQRPQLDRLIGLEGRLSKLSNVAVVYGPGTLLNQVAAQGQDFLATISGARDALTISTRARAKAAGQSAQQIKQTVAAALRDFDLRYVSLLIRALPVGLPTLANQNFVQSVVFDANGHVKPSWRFLVPTPTSVALIVRPLEHMDQASTRALVEGIGSAVRSAGLLTSRITVTGSPVIAAGLGTQLTHELPQVAALALALVVACYLILPWLPQRLRRVVPVVVTLVATAIVLAVFGWLSQPLSLGVVAFLPIVLGTGSDFPAYLVRGVDRRRVIVTGVAAAAGFATLSISPIPFVRQLGLALGLGVVLAVALGLVAARVLHVAPVQPERGPVALAAPALSSGRRLSALVVAGAIAIVGWMLLPQLRIDSNPTDLAGGAPVLVAARHAEAVLGTSGEIDLLIRGKALSTPAVLAWMGRAQRVLTDHFSGQVRLVLSPASLLGFLGRNPTQQQIDAGMNQIPGYLRAATMTSDGRQAVFSMGVIGDDIAHQESVIAAIHRALPVAPPGVDVQMAGLPAVTGRAYAIVSSNRYADALAGIGAAGIVLLLGLRRRGDTGRAMAAALLSAGWGLSGAWLFDVGLTPLTVALGSLAAATACEFTVLLGNQARGSSDARRAVLVAASAATCGYLSLGLSDLSVMRSFGFFLAATVLLSLGAARLIRYALPGIARTAGDQGDRTPRSERVVVTQ